MSKTVLNDGDDGVLLILRDAKQKPAKISKKADARARSPIHVVYGGADRYSSGTAGKLGDIALKSLETYAADLAAFSAAFGHTGVGTVWTNRNGNQIEEQFHEDPESLRSSNFSAWLATAVYHRTIQKLRHEPVEDFRIDFEDGYGYRPDAEEDADAKRCARELATAFRTRTITAFCGFRVKSYIAETRERAKRTLNIFLDEFLELTQGKLPDNFVVTLPKITDKKQVKKFCRDLRKIEKSAGLDRGSVKIELMIEHPSAIIDKRGRLAIKSVADAARGRCVAAHFGAYDYTASLGIAATHQDIAHPSCDFARQMMLTALKPLGIRLSDSVTTQMPVPIHKGAKLSAKQSAENKESVTAGWRLHYDNVRRSMANGFYQSWDLHPNQLTARYAAVYSFFLEAADAQASRLRAFIDKATQATLSGNTFDDAASAMGIVNFFRQGMDCGALREAEVEQAAGISTAALYAASFKEIIDKHPSR